MSIGGCWPCRKGKPMADERLISPNDCQHRVVLFIGESRETGLEDNSRYQVSLCADCGEFAVFTEKNGQAMHVTFTIWGEDALAAAGKYDAYVRAHSEAEQEPTRAEALRAMLSANGVTMDDKSDAEMLDLWDRFVGNER